MFLKNAFFEPLIVWQKAMDLVVKVYLLTSKLPKNELYVLSQQIKRCAISIPSNIAEGQSRKSTKEYIHFLSIARGSKSELETQLELSIRLGFLKEKETEDVRILMVEISKMLYTLQNALKSKLD